jgi:hypothetical protein
MISGKSSSGKAFSKIRAYTLGLLAPIKVSRRASRLVVDSMTGFLQGLSNAHFLRIISFFGQPIKPFLKEIVRQVVDARDFAFPGASGVKVLILFYRSNASDSSGLSGGAKSTRI